MNRPVLGIAVFLLTAPALRAGAEWFLTPKVEGAAGYTSNRFLETEAAGSGYWRASPGLDATWFGGAGLEAGGRLTYAHTEYLRTGFTRIRSAFGELEVRKRFPAGAASFAASSGLYEDGSLPEDDAWWVRGASSLSWDAAAPVAVSLLVAATHTRYESRPAATGGEQAETRWEARPGLRWSASPTLAVWVELSGEHNASNEDAEDFTAGGVTAGADGSWRNGVDAGVWAGWRVRRYPHRSLADGAAQRDTPLDAGAWGSYRLAPWCEVFGSATWYRLYSNEPHSEYEAWNVEGGVRFVYDWQVTGSI